jgi:hypothetical protein
MRQSLLLLFLFGAFSSFGQISNLQLSVAPNYTIIPSVTKTNSVAPLTANYGYLSLPAQPIASTRESYEGRPGLSLAIQGDYKFTSRFFVTTGLGVDYYRYQRIVKVAALSSQDDARFTTWSTYYVSQGTTVGQPYGQIRALDVEAIAVTQSSDNAGKTSVLFVQIPVMAGTSFFKGKLTTSGGFAFSAVVHASEVRTVYAGATDGFVDKTVDNTSDFQKFNVSGVVCVAYHFTEHFALHSTGSKSFSPLYSKETQGGDVTRMGAVSVGVRYTF